MGARPSRGLAEERPTSARILVAVGGQKVDEETVRLACRMAKARSAKLYGVHVIEVNRSLPLSAPVEHLVEHGEQILEEVEQIASETRTTVLYEAPHRVVRTLEDLSSACGTARRVCIGRELTKLHEEFWRGTLGGAVTWAGAGEPRGEWVVVLEGAQPDEAAAAEDEIMAALRRHLAAGETRKSAVDAVAAELRLPRRQVYQLAINPPHDSPAPT